MRESRHWPLIIIFLFFSTGVGTAGYFFYQSQKNAIRQDEWSHLGAIADLKVNQIAAWRKAREAQAAVIFNNQVYPRRFQKFLKNPESVPLGREISDWIKSLKEYLQYDSILFFDTTGAVRVSVPPGQEMVAVVTKTLASEAMNKKEVIFSDFYRNELTNAIRLSLLIPMLVRKGNDTVPVGVLLLCINPDRQLYPLIQSWPTPSPTAESLLIRREGEDGIFLNELRHRKNTALTFRFSMRERQLPAAMAASGREGTVEGVDYRGVPVLAVIQRVPDSPWMLLAKIDQEETYAPIRQEARFTGIVVGLLIIGAGLGVGFLWRGQLLHERRQIGEVLEKANTELEQRVQERTSELRAANEALRKSESRLRYLSSKLLTIQEQERKRVAGELHDSIAVSLSAIKLRIEKSLHEMNEGATTSESLGNVITMTQQTLQELRRIMADLQPSMLDDLGIVATISWFCREFEKTYPYIRVEKQIDLSEDAVPEFLRLVIYRISQEALNNVAKHSKANLATFLLRRTGETIELTVQDSGQGFDVEEALERESIFGGFGLSSMRERAELAGGSFTIESAKGRGTTISASWPL